MDGLRLTPSRRARHDSGTRNPKLARLSCPSEIYCHALPGADPRCNPRDGFTTTPGRLPDVQSLPSSQDSCQDLSRLEAGGPELAVRMTDRPHGTQAISQGNSICSLFPLLGLTRASHVQNAHLKPAILTRGLLVTSIYSSSSSPLFPTRHSN